MSFRGGRKIYFPAGRDSNTMKVCSRLRMLKGSDTHQRTSGLDNRRLLFTLQDWLYQLT